MASLQIKNLVKRYGSLNVVKGISFDITDGELVILVGPSGCGKSTLLRMIAGLETVDEGTIHIGEREVNDLQPKDRDIAMVFQSYALYPHMTVADNMSFALRMAGADQATRDAAVQRAASILSLEKLLTRFPRQLSGGQRQRVAMGRAIVRDPAVFLFDEPLSNLDAKLRVQMRAEIKELHKRLGSTIIYVTHDQTEAMTLADKIVCLKDGEIAQIGKPSQLYDRPENLFVAEFIGSPAMNLMPGVLSQQKATTSLDLGEGTVWTLPQAIVEGLQIAASGKVVLGIRPEHFRDAPVDGSKAIDVQISMLEPLGSDTLVHFCFNGNKLLARVPPEMLSDSDTSVTLHVDINRLHLFDHETGERLSH